MNAFNCPHCNGIIETVGVDPGQDATGAPAGQEFIPIDTSGWPKAPVQEGSFRPAFYAGFVGKLYYVLMPNRYSIPIKGGSLLPAYYVGDQSLSDLFKKQHPHVPCTNQ